MNLMRLLTAVAFLAVTRSSDALPPLSPAAAVTTGRAAPAAGAHRSFKEAISILVEDSHGGSDIHNEYNFGSAQLGRILAVQGATVEGTKDVKDFDPTAGLTPELLHRYGVVIVNGRFAGQSPPFRDSEIQAIADWVRAGGGLLVTCAAKSASDHQDPLYFNPLIKPYGLQFGNKDISDIYVPNPNKNGHSPLRGLAGFYVFHGISVVGKGAESLAHVGGDSVMMALSFGQGRMVAFGAGSALENQALNSLIIKHSPDKTVATNTDLLMNLALWLSGADP